MKIMQYMVNYKLKELYKMAGESDVREIPSLHVSISTRKND
jgi:hypothetical protein